MSIYICSSHHLSFSFAFFVHGESTVCASMDLRVHPAVRTLSPEYLEEAALSNGDAKQKPVILAPFGLAATLTGQSFRALDPVTQKALDDWALFYPLCNKDNSNLPPVVEVISGRFKKLIETQQKAEIISFTNFYLLFL